MDDPFVISSFLYGPQQRELMSHLGDVVQAQAKPAVVVVNCIQHDFVRFGEPYEYRVVWPALSGAVIAWLKEYAPGHVVKNSMVCNFFLDIEFPSEEAALAFTLRWL